MMNPPLAITRACPRCGAGPGDPCLDLRYVGPVTGRIAAAHPHRARRTPRENRPDLTPQPNRPETEL